MDLPATKQCTKCASFKPFDAFYNTCSYCKICYNKCVRDRRDKNRDAYNAKARARHAERMKSDEMYRKKKRISWNRAHKKSHKKLRSTPEGRAKIKKWSATTRKRTEINKCVNVSGRL